MRTSALFPNLIQIVRGLRTTPAAVSDRRFVGVFFLALIAFYGVFATTNYAGANGLLDNEGILIGRDFVVFWAASVLALAGDLPKIFDLAQFHAVQEELMGTAVPLYPWLYPPHGLFAILPLGLLPYLWSYLFWALATLALYLLAVLGRSWSNVHALALVLAPATFVNLVAGQNGFLTAALLIGGLRLLDRAPVLAGILLGLLCFKPQLGLLIPVALAAARLWRPFLSATVTVVALVALSVGVFGLESWASFLEMSTVYQSRHLNDDQGWFLNIVITPFMGARILGLNATASACVHAVFALAALVGVALTFRQEADRRLQIAVLLVAAHLASPYGYNYDLTLASVAALWSFEHAMRTGFLPGERLLLAVVWVLPLLVVVGNIRGIPLGAPVLGVLFLSLLARVKRWRREPAVAAPPGAGTMAPHHAQ